MRLVAPLSLACVLVVPAVADAQLNKCVGADGKVSYQSEPCPETSKAQTVRPPSSAPSASGGAIASQDGWDGATLTRMRDGCVAGGMRDGQAGWERAARTDPRAGPFPKTDFQLSADAFCTCLVGRVRTSIKPAEFEAKGLATMVRFTNEAMEGGQCRPTGVWARLLSGKW